MEKISVCIVDDNAGFLEAMQEMLKVSPGFLCMARIASAQDALVILPSLKPDVVLMDINLGSGDSGIDCVRILKHSMPTTNFMMCTVHDEDDKIFMALNAGATGYILKKADPAKMLDAIRQLHEGGAPMSSQIARKVVAAFQPVFDTESTNEMNRLTKREKQILEQLSRGLMYKEIAANLFIAHETIRKHVYHIYEKLHVNNRVAAVNKFFGRKPMKNYADTTTMTFSLK
jgi:DNA-binding NarL/FixJ family response regulator